MSRFDSMFLDNQGRPNSREDDLIQESLAIGEKWVDMGLIKAVEEACLAEVSQADAGKKARFDLNRYNPDDANSVQSVYTSGENQKAVTDKMHSRLMMVLNNGFPIDHILKTRG